MCLTDMATCRFSSVDVSYVTLQANRIVNVILHRKYPLGIVFFNPMESSNSIMSEMYTGINLVSTINPNRSYVK
jgi:hypothetical protein